MSLVNRLRRPDWLGEMQTLCVVGLVVTGLAMVVSVAWAILGDEPVTVQVRADAVIDVPDVAGGLADGVTIAPDSIVEVEVTDPSAHQLIAKVMTSLPTMLTAFGMLLMLLRVVRRGRRGDPFAAGTVRELRVLAVLVIVGGTLAGVVESLAMLDLSFTVTDTAGYAMWHFPAGWLLAGFGFLAIAEVVRRGTAMRDELATVI